MTSNSPGYKNNIKCSSPPLKLLNITKSLKKLYDSELFLDKLTSLLPQVDIIDIKSFLSMSHKLLEKNLYTLESLPLNKKKIWTDKLNLFNKNFLNTQSLKILDLDLTSKEKDLSPFWNKSCQEMSKKLLLPSMTDLQGLDLNLFCSSVNTSIQNLPFSQIKTINQSNKNLQTTSSQSLHIIPQNSMVCENMTYTRKIRFYPNTEQKKYFKSFFGATRYLYNKTIDLYKNRDKTKPFSLSLPNVRPLVLKNNNELMEEDPEFWLKNIPYDTRQLAIKSALSSIKSSLELLKNKQIKYFNHKFKSKKNNKQIFYVDHRALKNLTLFPSLLKDNSKLKVKKRYKQYENYVMESDGIILKDGAKYFILFSKEKKNEEKEKEFNIISLDPGIKKFQSFYTPEGYVGSIGDINLRKKIMKIEKRIDKLKSLSKSKNKREQKKIEKKCYKLKTKVKNIIKDFHWKISSYLTTKYKVVLLPIFKTMDLRKNLNKTNNRIMNIYSHYQFQQKLIYQGKKNCSNVRIVEEHYTTKTCGNCGYMNHFVGNSNVFWCPKCKKELERDYQAARNILLKNIWGLINPLK